MFSKATIAVMSTLLHCTTKMTRPISIASCRHSSRLLRVYLCYLQCHTINNQTFDSGKYKKPTFAGVSTGGALALLKLEEGDNE